MGKSIEELENDFWGEPTFKSGLVKNVHRLRKKPTEQFSVEDLRLMIGQNIGTQYLMPRALGLLEQSPFVWGWHFPGELLSQVFRLPESYWVAQHAHLEQNNSYIQSG